MEKNDQESIKIEDWMRQLSEQFEAHASEETRKILEDVRNGKLDIETALRSLTEQIFKNPKEVNHLYQIAKKIEVSEDGTGLYQPPVGLPRLDPIFEAELHERLQFDEDAPELRYEGKPAEVTPAVSVKDAPTSPIALGKALKEASEKVAQEFKQLIKNNDVYLPTMTQPLSYPVGQIPPSMMLGKIEELSSLTKEEERQYAWKSISTTQGRRSLVPNLTKGLLDELNGFGYLVSEGVFNAKVRDTAIALERWDISFLGSGPKSTNQNFSYFHTSVKALSVKLRVCLQSKNWNPEQPLVLMVSTWDVYSDRQFGWVAFLCAEK